MENHIAVVIWCLVFRAAVAVQALDDNSIATADRQSKLGLGLGTDTLTQLAQNLLSRSTTSSQVLSLNLTNLVILLVVKALIFGAGSIGLGGGDHLGRSVDHEKRHESRGFISEPDVMMMLSYMNGAVNNNYHCLYASACQNPKKAREYFTASNILVKGAQMLNITSEKNKYEEVLAGMDEAAKFGSKGYDCRDKYKCDGVS